MVYDPIVMGEVLSPEKEREKVISIPGRKGASNETEDKNVSGREDLRTTEVSHKKNVRPD